MNMYSTLNRFIVIIFICLLPFGATYSQTILTDRPDQTEGSSTVPKGSVQIESGVLIAYTGEGLDKERQLLAPTTLFRVGLTKGIELRLLSQFESVKDFRFGQTFNGISDLEIGTKIQIFKKEENSSEVALLSHLVIPTGTDVLTNNVVGTINKLSISHVVNENFGIGYNLGYNYFGEGNGDFTYTLAFGIGINDKLSVYFEPYGEIANFEAHFSSFDAGFTYLVQDNLQLDFSFGTGINYNMNYLSLGCSWLILANK